MQKAQETRDMRKSVVEMVNDFKRKSMSRQRKQTSAASVVAATSQVNISSHASMHSDKLINTTYEALI